MPKENNVMVAEGGKCLIIVHSYHHNNTAKIADVFAKVLHAPVKRIDQVTLAELEDYDLIGFGAGIDSGRHYKELLDLADQLPEVCKKSCFIFSTSAIIGEDKVAKDHSALSSKPLWRY
jgi:menaquinone-dependent protoporphyrinogen IX oxidase